MAIQGRAGVTETVGDNIYDNTAKEIDPDKTKAALAAIIESFFNLVDDELHSLNYQGGNPLSDFIAPPKWGATGYFDVGSTGGTLTGNEGIVQSATTTQLTGADTEVAITFSENLSNRKLSINVFTNSSNMNQNDDICTPVIRVINGTSIRVGLREVSGAVQSVRLEILAFKI